MLTTVAVLVVLFFVGLVYRQMVLVPRWKAKEARLKDEKNLNAELERINRLNRIHTISQWLMRVPEHLVPTNAPRRSYGTRWNRVFIVDEMGIGWVGLATQEIVGLFRASEYIRQDYHLPFRGDGERIDGRPVTIDGLDIDTYPTWMKVGVNPQDWDRWAKIEKNFKDQSDRGWNCQDRLYELKMWRDEFLGKRKKLELLEHIVATGRRQEGLN